jgi:1,2-dihydroxy-3-keto-5-methylthiopentene dioxygenase
MINELTSRLTAIGLSEEMANKAIETVADFAKSKLPEQFHGALDDVMAGDAAQFEGEAFADDASDAAILAAYADPIARLSAARGYRSADVIRLQPDHPERDAMRARFLAEHVHDEDEVRFFVEGSGMFYIHAGGQVHALLCTAGDLIALPMGTRHWFDMGEHPRFTAIRLFTRPDGWVARFTGDPIADAVPLYAGAG